MSEGQSQELVLGGEGCQALGHACAGALRICSRDPAYRQFLSQLQQLMDSVVQEGISQGLFREEDRHAVRSPLRLAANENGCAMPGHLDLLAAEVRMESPEEVSRLEGMPESPYAHARVEFLPEVGEDGWPRVACRLHVPREARKGDG